MAVHTTLDALYERVLAEEERKFDLLADTRRMSVEIDRTEGEDVPEVLLTVDQPTSVTSLRMSDHALGQMATDLDIPKRYFDRMRVEAPELFKTNTLHWMYKAPKRRMLRAYKSNRSDNAYPDTARAWLSDRYRRLDNIEIARRLLPELDKLGTEVVFHNAAITETKFYLRATFPAMEKAIKLGDPVQWGIQIRNSEVGDGEFAIENFALVLSCLNGMVMPKVMSARHVGKRLGENLSDEAIRADDKAFWLAARDELRAAISEENFADAIRKMQKATEGETISAPIAATERLAKQLSLTDGERDAVLLELAQGGDMSRWGALNAVTAAAKQSDTFDRRVEMEEAGWSMAELSEKEWSRIAVAA